MNKSIYKNLSRLYYLKILLLVLFCSNLSAQECNCNQEFLFVKKQIETNYSGFKDKTTTSSDKKAYLQIVKELDNISKSTTNSTYCFIIFKRYLAFFKDHHVQISSKQADTLSSTKNKVVIETIELTPQLLEKLSKKTTKEIEGIYNEKRNNYKVAIVKSKTAFRDYAAVLIESKFSEWKPNQVKFELKEIKANTFQTIYYNKDHSLNLKEYIIKDGVFQPNDFLKKGADTNVTVKEEYEPFKEEEYAATNCFTKLVNDSTIYVRIKSFGDNYASNIDSVFKANETLIKSKPYLIIDVRYNGGGSTFTYAPIIPYIYTNPIKSVGADIFSTPDNIISWQRMMKEHSRYFSEEDKIFWNDLIEKMKKNTNKFTSQGDDDVKTLTQVYVYPKKVGVIINDGCASTTEQFILEAKQSTKVTFFGTHSAGVLDYANVRDIDFPCMNYILKYATTRSRRLPKNGIDNVGIMPNINLTFSEDWLKKVNLTLSNTNNKNNAR